MDVPKVISIIGGTGMMGQLFREKFEREGIEVICSGRTTSPNNEEAAVLGDVVIVCVPIDKTSDTIKSLGPLVREDALLTDFTSLKEFVVEEMLENCSCDCVGGHPLFGPQVKKFSNHTFVLTKGRGEKYVQWYEGFLRGLGLNVVWTTTQKHDKMMAFTQSFPYFVLFSFGRYLDSIGADFDEIKDFVTPNSTVLYSLFVRFINQDLGMDRDILMQNPYSGSMRTDFAASVAESLSLFGDGDAMLSALSELSERHRNIEKLRELGNFFVKCMQSKEEIEGKMGWEDAGRD